MRPRMNTNEIVAVLAILTLLAALITPELSSSASEARLNQTTFHLQTLRTAIAKYKGDHQAPPENLHRLTQPGPCGRPYLGAIPAEFLTSQDAVEVVSEPSKLSIPRGRKTGGWLYSPVTGEVRVNLGGYRKL